MSIRYCGEFPLTKKRGDIGYDLYCAEDKVVIEDGKIAKINSGTIIEFHDGYYGDVRPKSGMSNQGLMTQLGLVDSSYRGEISVVMINHTGKTVTFEFGDKIAQLVLRREYDVMMEKVPKEYIDRNTWRGNKGFGSTGSKYQNNLSNNNLSNNDLSNNGSDNRYGNNVDIKNECSDDDCEIEQKEFEQLYMDVLDIMDGIE